MEPFMAAESFFTVGIDLNGGVIFEGRISYNGGVIFGSLVIFKGAVWSKGGFIFDGRVSFSVGVNFGGGFIYGGSRVIIDIDICLNGGLSFGSRVILRRRVIFKEDLVPTADSFLTMK